MAIFKQLGKQENFRKKHHWNSTKMASEDHMEVDEGEFGFAVDREDGILTRPVMEERIEQEREKIKKKFEIRKWTAVLFWSWDMVVENCAICRNHLMEPCIECQPNTMSQTAEECQTAWGKCNHAFHLHCITRWTNSRNVCPLDNREWVLLRYGK